MNLHLVGGGGGVGVLWIFSDGHDRRIFLLLEFSFSGIFLSRKIGRYSVFFGWLDLSRDFFGYS